MDNVSGASSATMEAEHHGKVTLPAEIWPVKVPDNIHNREASVLATGFEEAQSDSSSSQAVRQREVQIPPKDHQVQNNLKVGLHQKCSWFEFHYEVLL
jgi:hypothetical protein